jgi:diguanylate cyclase (GGDEF)-like protein
MADSAVPPEGHPPRESAAEVAPAAPPVSERAAFSRRFAAEIERAARYSRPCSLAILDIHHLRSANAAHGRAAGDGLIAELDALIRGQLRQSDEAFRYGGDEFVLILPETDFAGASAALKRICERADGLCRAAELPSDVRLRGGVASFPQDAEAPKPLFLVADTRLRESKRDAATPLASRIGSRG